MTTTGGKGGTLKRLTIKEAGIIGDISIFEATFSVTDEYAIVYVDMILGEIENPFEVLKNLANFARTHGVNILRIEASIANERLYYVLTKRYGMVTEGGRDFIEIYLK